MSDSKIDMAVREVPVFLHVQNEGGVAQNAPAPDFSPEKKAASAEKKSPRKRASRKVDAASVQAPTTLSFPYDANLLKRTYTQWQFGDWDSLIALDSVAIENHPDRARLALFISAGHLQSDHVVEGKKYLELANQWGISKRFACQILAAGLHNNLGRVAAIFGNKNIALKHFESALEIGGPGDDVRLLAQARMAEQYKLIARAKQRMQNLPNHSTSALVIDNKPISDVTGFLRMLHDTLAPGLYLQLGVSQGEQFELAKGLAVGVDPLITERVSQRDNYSLVASSSDEFFSIHADQYIDKPIDLVFIDGVPLAEYTLRDLIAVERLSSPRTVVAVSGIYPKTVEQSGRRRSGSDWCGDVWKLPILLQKFRPDLKCIEIDIEPYGLVLIGNLDCSNTNLSENINQITDEINSTELVPDRIFKRDAAEDSGGAHVRQFLNNLFDCKK